MKNRLWTLLFLCFYCNEVYSQSWSNLSPVTGKVQRDYSRIAVDDKKNIYVTGVLKDSLLLDTVKVSLRDSSTLFLAKYNDNKTVIWAKTISSTGTILTKDITVSDDGFIYVAGFFSDTVFHQKGYDISKGDEDVFVIKIDSNGNQIWFKAVGGIYIDNIGSIFYNKKGIYLYGMFGSQRAGVGGNSSSISLDTIILNTTKQPSIFIAILDTSGSFSWAKAFPRLGFATLGTNIQVDNNSNIYISAGFSSLTAFDQAVLHDKSSGFTSPNGCVIKFDSTGYGLWGRAICAINPTGWTQIPAIVTPPKIDIDEIGNVYLYGLYVEGKIIFDNNYILDNHLLQSELYIAKFNTNGDFVWAKNGQWNTTQVEPIATSLNSTQDKLLITGSFNYEAHSGTDTIKSTGSADVFVAQYDTSGTEEWIIGAGGAGYDVPLDMAIDNQGDVYVCGGYNGNSISFGSNVITNSNPNAYYELFIAKLSTTPTNIQEQTNSRNGLEIYPNPTPNTFFINTKGKAYYQLSIADITGRVVYSRALSSLPKATPIAVKLPQPPGMYFIKLSNEKETVTGKIMIR